MALRTHIQLDGIQQKIHVISRSHLISFNTKALKTLTGLTMSHIVMALKGFLENVMNEMKSTKQNNEKPNQVNKPVLNKC